MDSKHTPVFRGARSVLLGCWLLILPGLTIARATEAAVPESKGRLAGFYKVVASNDPQFPVSPKREYFLDFGKGIQADRLSGSVAISQRENPVVRIPIVAWQYFPKNGSLAIGHPFAEGSCRAVAAGVWQLRASPGSAVLRRDRYQIVLRRADP